MFEPLVPAWTITMSPTVQLIVEAFIDSYDALSPISQPLISNYHGTLFFKSHL